MPFEGAVRSRLSSWLRPWLRSEPDVELKLGFLRCQGTWKDLELDPASLDPLIKSSTRLAFKQVRVGELSVRFTPWSSPSLLVNVRSFHVTVAPRELSEEVSGMTGDSDEVEKKRAVDSIDPEGALLRGVLENALKTASSGSWLRTSLTEAVLRRCRFKFQDISLQLQLSEESSACLLKARELTMGAHLLDENNVPRGTTAVFFMPREESHSLAFSCSQLEFGLKENGLVKVLLSSRDPHGCVRLKKLRPMRLDIHFPLIDSGFSPLDIPVIFLVSNLLSGPSECHRNGMVLWRIAARRIALLNHHPRVSFHKLVNIVLQWLGYVHAYESLLSLIGYSDENLFKQFFMRMCNDIEFLRCVQHRLRMVDELEKCLSVEAVGRARRIARQRVLSCSHGSDSELAGFHIALKGKISVLLLFVWRIIYFLFHLVANIIPILQNVFTSCRQMHKMYPSPSGGFFGVSDSHNCVNLTVGEFLISLHPITVACATSNDKGGVGRDISQSNLSSFFFSMKSFYLGHIINTTGRSTFLALGDFRIHFSSSLRVPLMESDLELEKTPSFRVPWAETGNGSRAILWSEPAHSLHSPGDDIDSKHSVIDVQAMVLDNCLRGVWASWKMIVEELEGNNVFQVDDPFFLFEFRNSFINLNLSKVVGGFSRYSIALGKLNFDLEYSSIVSLALLFRQTLDSLSWIANVVKPHVPSNSCDSKEKKEIKLEEQLELLACRIKRAMLDMMPENNIQVGAMITGPNIKLSFPSLTKQDRAYPWSSFSLDLECLEVAIWPASRTTLLALNPGWVHEAPQEDLWLKEPQMLDIPEGQLNKSFISWGRISRNIYLSLSALTAFFEKLEDNQRSQVVGPVSMQISASTCRCYLHSFYSTDNACSLSVSGMAGETDVLLYMDELYTLFQVFEGMLPITSIIAVDFNYAVFSSSREYIREISSAKRVGIGNQMMIRAEDRTLYLQRMQATIDAYVEFGFVGVILNNSRKKQFTLMKSDGASSSAVPYHDQKLLHVPDFGIGIFLPKSHIQISYEEGHVKLLTNLSEIRSVIFKPQNEVDICDDVSMTKDVLHCSRQLCEFSFSCFILHLSASCDGVSLSSAGGNAINASTSSSMEPVAKVGPFLPVASKGSVVQLLGSRRAFPSMNIPTQGQSYCLTTEIQFGEIFLADCGIKSLVTGCHQLSRFQLLMSSSGSFHVVQFESQGACFFIETSTLAMFIESLKAYSLCLRSMSRSSRKQWDKAGARMVLDESMVRSSNLQRREYTETNIFSIFSSEQWKWWFFKSIDMNVVQFSVTFAITDGSGGVQGLTLETDINIRLTSLEKRLSFNVLKLTALFQHLHKNSMSGMGIDLIPFHSGISSDLPTHVNSGPLKGISSGVNNAQSSMAVSEREISLDNDVSRLSLMNHRNYILKHLSASIVVEKTALNSEVDTLRLKSDWVGIGSISGFDLTISLSEIQMLLALVAPLRGISGMKAGKILKHSFGSQPRGGTNYLPVTVPDGAIVAIQDLHQHLYFAVERIGIKYRVVGALHYSIVGERALFRVKWHKQKPSLFSLTSLHAKNDAGELLRLNFCSGSGLVEISSNNDRGWALWNIIPYKADNYGDEDHMELYNYFTSARKAFHLINHKNNSGVAFVDGFPEFVQKPGSPFKLKLFHEHMQAHDAGKMHPCSHIGGSVKSISQGDRSCEDGNTSLEGCNLMHMDITVDRVVFTVSHDVSEADRFPLVRGCIGDVHVTGQILPSKFRLICTYFIAVDYFNSQRNIWREMVSPVDACCFLHFRSALKGARDVQKGMPAHYYFRIKQVDISLTELSMDILLFIVGKLNVVGPYALRSSIFCNCCKVENLSTLNLICHFDDNQDAIVTGKQSTSVFLRHISSADQLPEIRSAVSIVASENGGSSTLPLHISLSNAQVAAWRTCVVSQEDSQTLLGPSLVIEVSKKTEDGLSLVISPLSRIHNSSGFSMELRLCTPGEKEVGSITIPLQTGDTIDDSRALLQGLDYSGGLTKAMTSLSEGNFLLSVKPDISGFLEKSRKPISVDWSKEIIGGNIVPLSGIFDKLSYTFRKVFGAAPMKSSLSTVCCPLIVEGCHVSDIHFLIQIIGRDVPIVETPNVVEARENETLPFTFQKEIFISPTVQVSNLLQTDIVVVLTETYPDLPIKKDYDDIGKYAIIPCGSSAYFYANPTFIYFTVTLVAFSSTCKPVDTSECIRKLRKQKTEAHYFDIKLDFSSGKYFASLRLTWGEKGILEATVFASYTLQNDTELSLFCSPVGQKLLSQAECERYSSIHPPERGTFLPPMSMKSWFLRSNRVYLRLMEENASESLLDLDTLSGFTELQLESCKEVGVNRIAKIGVSLKPCVNKVFVPAQLVSIVPRYIISNESTEPILIRQCDLENDADGITLVGGKHKAVFYMHTNTRKRSPGNFFDSVFRKHRNVYEDSLVFVQFRLKEIECSWSGPICISSLGRFFMKFKIQPIPSRSGSNADTDTQRRQIQFASVYIMEEGSSLVLHFHVPPDLAPPYRIENCLHDVSITYYQKDSGEMETLGSGDSVEYVWDDLNLPHKLLVQISGVQMLREINIDKICTWKPFFKPRQNKLLTLHSPLSRMSTLQNRQYDESHAFEILRLGYEVYAEGLTRVFRICEFSESYREEEMLQPHTRFQFRVGHFASRLLEHGKQDEAASVPQPVVVARLVNITLDLLSGDHCTYFCSRIESINVDNRWQGAPFASMVRRSQLHDSFPNEEVLHCVFIIHSNDSSVKQVKRFSLVLQPIDLNLDEETLMKLATFWRTSLSDSKAESQLYYFKQFEIHPIKIRTSFLPGNPHSSYSSTQETLRSLLHSVIKVPSVKNTVIELNGVLLNHALVTKRELLIKCAQHYSWYVVRAVYIAKGSPLLPPAFASIFDDAASSSLDVFFDPSDGSINLPGLTLGMFKFVSKCIDSRGFSGTKRYFGDLSKTMKKAGSNVLFAAITEISDSILKGAETDGFNGLVNGFHQGILRLALEPSLLGAAVMQGGPDRKIILDQSPGVNELYIEGYLQAMLHTTYKQEYLQVKVIDNVVQLKNLPPNSSLINEIVENVKSFLISQGLLKGETSSNTHRSSHLRGESEWRIGPMVLTLCEHLFVSFTIRMLRNQADTLITGIRSSRRIVEENGEPSHPSPSKGNQGHPRRIWAVGSFVLSGMFAYVDGWLCRHIPNPIARRIVSGFLLTFLEKKDTK